VLQQRLQCCRKKLRVLFQATDGFLFVIQCDTGRVIYVSDSITPVLNQSQVSCLHLYLPFGLVHAVMCFVMWLKMCLSLCVNLSQSYGALMSYRTVLLPAPRRCGPKSLRHVWSVSPPCDSYETCIDHLVVALLSVCAECRCIADFQSLLPGICSAATSQITLASDARMYFIPAGSAGVSLPPRLCTWLPGLRSSACVTSQCTSVTVLFYYINAGHFTHCVFYHWRPHFSSDCCIGLEQFAGVSPVIAVSASFPQQTEDRTVCQILQLFRV